MTKMLRKLARDRSGATAIEYGLIAAFIGVALVATLGTLRDNLKTKYGQVSAAVATDPNATGTTGTGGTGGTGGTTP